MQQLRTGKLRGVPFVFTDGSAAFGRRVVPREFPQRNTIATEDLGRAMREFRLVGFVVGDDWKTQRDKLIKAAETPGPAKLTHPTFGELTVVIPPKGLAITESSSALRMVAFTLTALETGDLAFPTAKPSAKGPSNAAALAVNDNALAQFLKAFDTALGGFVLDDALADALEGLELVAEAVAAPLALVDAASDVLDTIATMQEGIAELLATPELFVVALQGVFAQLEDLAALDAFTAELDDPSDPYTNPGEGDTPAEQAASTNTRALVDLYLELALAELAIQVADTEWASFDAATEARDKYTRRITAKAERTFTPGESYEALVDLRTVLAVNVTSRAADLPRLRTHTPAELDVSIVLAHELYGDASRSREIEDRNGTHAVIGEPVRVLVS